MKTASLVATGALIGSLSLVVTAPSVSAHDSQRAISARSHGKVATKVVAKLARTHTLTDQANVLKIKVRGHGTPKGKVRVFMYGVKQRTARLSHGKAVVSLFPQWNAGSPWVIVKYSGNSHFKAAKGSARWTVSLKPLPTTPPANTTSLKIGSYNIEYQTTTAEFGAAVRSLVPYADIIGLQEMNRVQKELPLYDLQKDGWSYFRDVRPGSKVDTVGGAEQTPILWRTARFNYEQACRMQATPKMSIHGESPQWNNDAPSWFQVVKLTDRRTGQKLAIIDAHLLHNAVYQGEPKRGFPYSWKIYKTQLHSLVAQAQKQTAAGRLTFVMGDTNAGWDSDKLHRNPNLPVRQFQRIGMRSMWETQHPAGHRGTHLQGLIDQVFSKMTAWRSTVLFNLKGSDHFPALAQYMVPIGTPIPGDNVTPVPSSPPPMDYQDRKATPREPVC